MSDLKLVGIDVNTGQYKSGTITIGEASISGTGPLGLIATGSNAITLTTNSISRSSVTSDGAQQWSGITTVSAPAVSGIDEVKFFYDKTLQSVRISKNTSAWAAFGSAPLSDVLAVGNTTGSNNIIISSGQKIAGAPGTVGVGGTVLIESGAQFAGSGAATGEITIQSATTTGSSPVADSGGLNIFSGNASGTTSGGLNIYSGDCTGSDGDSGFINLTTGAQVGDGNTTGAINLRTGTASGAAYSGSIEISTGNAGSNNGLSGNIVIRCGNASSGTPGFIELRTRTGAFSGIHGNINIQAGGDINFGTNGGTVWRMDRATGALTPRWPDSYDLGQSANHVQKLWVNEISTSALSANNSTGGLITLSPAGFRIGSNGGVVETPAFLYDPVLGVTITKWGNSILVNGDGANNTISGQDATASKKQTLNTVASQGATYDLSGAGLTTFPVVPGTVVIQVVVADTGVFRTITDNGAGVLPVGSPAVLSAPGTINYTTGAMTGTTLGLENASAVYAYYVVANTAGEPLTPRGGDGVGTGAGGELRLRGGRGGPTGNGASASLTSGGGGSTSGNSGDTFVRSGAVVSGTVGVVEFGVGGASQWRITTTGDFIAITDNSKDIGASGANRPKSIYLSTSAIFGSSNPLTVNGTSITRPSAGISIGDSGQTVTFPGSVNIQQTLQANALPVPVVLSITSVTLTAAPGTTPLYTVPALKKAILTGCVVIPTTATSAGGNAVMGIGVTGSDIFTSQSLTGLNATTQQYTYLGGGLMVKPGAADVISTNLVTSDTGNTLVADVHLIGYLI